MHVAFTFLATASWYTASIFRAVDTRISQIISLWIYYQSIGLVNQDHGLIILAFYFPYLIELQ